MCPTIKVFERSCVQLFRAFDTYTTYPSKNATKVCHTGPCKTTRLSSDMRLVISRSMTFAL